MSKSTRRHFNPEEKVDILKRHLLEDVPISDLYDEIGLHPNVFYQWQRQFFVRGAAAFRTGRQDPSERARQRELERLKSKLVKRTRSSGTQRGARKATEGTWGL